MVLGGKDHVAHPLHEGGRSSESHQQRADDTDDRVSGHISCENFPSQEKKRCFGEQQTCVCSFEGDETPTTFFHRLFVRAKTDYRRTTEKGKDRKNVGGNGHVTGVVASPDGFGSALISACLMRSPFLSRALANDRRRDHEGSGVPTGVILISSDHWPSSGRERSFLVLRKPSRLRSV